MKSIATAILLFIGQFMLAQQSPTVLEINSALPSVSCENDQAERTVRIESIENDVKSTVGNFLGKGCAFSISQSMSLGKYVATIITYGFPEQRISFEITESNRGKITLQSVTFSEKLTELGEVTVYGNKRQYIKMESDKTTVSIKENAMLNTGNAFDAVKKLPGVVSAPAGGGLSLNGKGVRVYIDGAPSSLSGTDLENYLSTLPASAIEKVELIYNPGAAFDANSSGSIINIITSSKRMKGINASFNMNYNFNKYQKPSPQILLNGKEKDLSWQTMYGVNYIEGENLNITTQEFTFFNPKQNLVQRNLGVFIWRNMYWRTGLNYKLNDKSNLLFNYNMSVTNDFQRNLTSTVGSGIDFRNNGQTRHKSAINELSLQYKVKLDTLGRAFDITAYSNFFRRNPLTESTSFENGNYTYNNSDIEFKLDNYYLKYDFAIPFKELEFSVNTGGKYNVNKVRDFGRYNFESSSSSIFGSGVYGDAIDFDYFESNVAFYAEARKKIEKFNITAGLRFEDYNIERKASTIADKIQYKNTNFFPNLSLMYELNKEMSISSSYSRRISQPGYFTIDPNNSSIFNKYNTSQGNAALAPVFFNNYDLKFSAFNYVQLGMNYSLATDDNKFIIEAEDGELISNRTFVSFDELTVFSVYLNFPIPLDYFFKGKEEFLKRMNTIDKMNYIFVNANYVKTTTEGYPLGYPNKGTFNFGAQSQILLPWGVTNNMSYFMLPKGIWEIYRIDKPIQQFDISFNKDLMNKRLKIGLHCFDVFNSNEVNAYVTGKNLNTHFYEKTDSRNFRFSITYNFGNLKLEKDDTNINTDKVNSGSGMMK